MKPTLLFCVFLIIGTSKLLPQVQIGQDIDGLLENQNLGRDIALSDNGDILAVMSNSNAEKELSIYREESGEWVKDEIEVMGEMYGLIPRSIALSGDGLTMAIAIQGTGGMPGDILVFDFFNGGWERKGNEINDGYYTSNLSLSYNGDILALGKPCSGGPGLGPPPACFGNVWIYRFESDSWYSTGSIYRDISPINEFGQSIDLSQQGEIIAIGSLSSTEVYRYNSENWEFSGEPIQNSVPSRKRVSLSLDGNFLSVAESLDEEPYSTIVRGYELINDSWVQIGQDLNFGTPTNYPSVNISLSGDGKSMAVGVPSNQSTSEPSRTILYKLKANQWVTHGEEIVFNSEIENEYMVVRLSSDANRVAVSSPRDDGSFPNTGKVRVFELDNVLSVDEFKDSEVKLFPNPTSNNIELVLPSGLELQKINILSILGQKVLTAKTTQINLSFLSQGTYYAEIITNKGSVYKKIIVN